MHTDEYRRLSSACLAMAAQLSDHLPDLRFRWFKLAKCCSDLADELAVTRLTSASKGSTPLVNAVSLGRPRNSGATAIREAARDRRQRGQPQDAVFGSPSAPDN
jgi:hypothetical protein